VAAPEDDVAPLGSNSVSNPMTRDARTYSAIEGGREGGRD